MARARQTAGGDPTESSHERNGSTLGAKEAASPPLSSYNGREDVKALALGVAISILLVVAMKLLEYRLLEHR